MSQVLSSQIVTRSNSEPMRQKRLVTVTLWTIQVLLALVFLLAGSMKLILPIEMLTAQMPLPDTVGEIKNRAQTRDMLFSITSSVFDFANGILPGLFVHFIGVAEVAGALGLILPGLTRIQRRLTPLAACGLVIIMIGATVVTLAIGGGASALIPLVVGLLATGVAYGRRSWGRRA